MKLREILSLGLKLIPHAFHSLSKIVESFIHLGSLFCTVSRSCSSDGLLLSVDDVAFGNLIHSSLLSLPSRGQPHLPEPREIVASFVLPERVSEREFRKRRKKVGE